MANETIIDPANARHKTMHRIRGQDPTTYSIPARKRNDAKFTMAGVANEVLFNNVADSVGRRVRVKNVSGGTYAKGSLVGLAGALTVQTTDTASNNPTAGTGVVITIAGSWQVGMEVAIVSGGKTDYAIITAVGSGNITVDFLFYDHTLPVVTAEPAYEISLADADAAAPAEWVLPAEILAGEFGYAYDCWEVTGLDTSAFSAEALLYLSATAGTYTATGPTGVDQIQQVVGIVKSSHATTGAILFIPGLKRILKIGSSMIQTGAAGVADGDKGDITVSSTGTVWTIDNLVVTNAKIANGTIDLTAKVTGTLPVANGGTGITSLGAGVATFLGTPSSANLRTAITDETGTGSLVFATSPTLVTPVLGTPSSGTLTSCTGLPISTGLTGLSNGHSPVQRAGAIVSAYPGQVLSKSANYTVVASDNGATILCDASGGAFTITLTAVATLGQGFEVTIKKTSADTATATNAVTVDANSTETIDGALTNRLQAKNSHVTLVVDGANWAVKSADDWIQVIEDTTWASFPANGTYGGDPTLSVPPGDWDLSTNATYQWQADTISELFHFIGTASGNSAAGLSPGNNTAYGAVFPTATRDSGGCVPNYRVSLTATTSYYMKFYTAGASTVPRYRYRFSARRNK